MQNELFDVFAIKHSDRIYKNEVLNSGHGGVLSEMLSNSDSFIKFDNQESFLNPIIPMPPGSFGTPASDSTDEQLVSTEVNSSDTNSFSGSDTPLLPSCSFDVDSRIGKV